MAWHYNLGKMNYFLGAWKNTHYFIVSRGQTEKAMAPHSSTLAWKIPWTGEPGGLQSMGWLRVRHDWATSLSLFPCMHWRRKWQPTPVFLPGESQGRGSLVGCRRRGRRESDTTEVTQQQEQQLGPEVCAWLYWVICVCACVLSHCSRVQLCATLWTVAPSLLCPWDSPGKNAGVGCHALLQRIFPTQGLNHIFYVSCIDKWVLYHWEAQFSK